MSAKRLLIRGFGLSSARTDRPVPVMAVPVRLSGNSLRPNGMMFVKNFLQEEIHGFALTD